MYELRNNRTECRDFPQMAEDPKIDGLTYPIHNIDLVGTTGSGKKAVQSGTQATAVSLSDGPISNMSYTSGTSC